MLGNDQADGLRPVSLQNPRGLIRPVTHRIDHT